jgi:hypothetical protein
MRNLLPRYRTVSLPEGRVSSFRWLGTGWDSFISKNLVFVQFGRRPVKFICLLSKTAKAPLFILAAKWQVLFNSKRLKVGTTGSPINASRLWRTKCPTTN